MVQQLANASKDADASIVNWNCHAAHVPKPSRATFCKNSVALAELLDMFSQKDVSKTSKSADKFACDVITSLEGNASHRQLTMQKRLDLLPIQGGSQSGFYCTQKGPFPWVSGSRLQIIK